MIRLVKATKKAISNVYHDTTIGKILLLPIKALIDNADFNASKDREYIKKKYASIFNSEPNIDKPTTFNEKLQWLKLNDRSPLHTICADKLAVREIIKREIGEQYLIPLLLETVNVNDITKENLPEAPFVIKTNHDSGNVFVVTDKDNTDYEHIRHKLKHSLRHNYYHTSREWQYKNIKPTIIVERFISDNHGEIPRDYKIHCFNCKPEFIQVDSNRFEGHRRTNFDINWNELPFTYNNYPYLAGIAKPKYLEKMLELASALAKPFPYARIDFYDTGDHLYFGEITFHPVSGFGPFEPAEWDNTYGNKLPLTKSTSYNF